jgi:hypothetical protein
MGDVRLSKARRLASLKPFFGGFADPDVGMKRLGRNLPWEKVFGWKAVFQLLGHHVSFCLAGAMGEGNR